MPPELQQELLRIDEHTIASCEMDATVAGLLAGFAITALVTLLALRSDRRWRVSLLIAVLVVATNFLLVAACAAWATRDYALLLQRRSVTQFPEESLPVLLIASGAFLLGAGSLTLAVALLGWLRSGCLGLFSMLIAGLALFVFVAGTSALSGLVLR